MSVEAATPDAPVLIPVPPDFPVTWPAADDETKFWTHDRTHAPHALPPLDADVWVLVYSKINPGGAPYEMPVDIRPLILNAYLYVSVTPSVAPEEMDDALARSEQRFDEAMGRLESSWTDEWLPEIQSHLDWWTAFDLRRASMPDLMAHARETVSRLDRLFHLHFTIVMPAYMAINQFDELYRDLFKGESAFTPFKLLQGFDNKTLESGRELWKLSRKALAVPDLAAVLQRHEPADIVEALEGTDAGRAFGDEFRAYLQKYGQRGDKWGLCHRSWIEDPTPALKNLKDYAAQPALDFDADHAALRAERDLALADIGERLKGYPAAVRERFAFLLKAAQTGYMLSEEHGFWIDFAAMYRVRLVMLEIGRRLADAGVLSEIDDVFFLTMEEALAADDLLRNGAFCRQRVAWRKAELERCRQMNPPPALGTDYGPPPDDMIGQFLTKFFGGPPPVSDTPDVVMGHAGSPGRVRGRARVIRSLEEAGRLQQGEILVTETTAPPWTPLFATAGGIVTDAGGILSHCAVVAREYRIPAVVGTGGGTAVIVDGQMIEVDGDAGAVRILGE
jgi:pyruvate,water dikinase